MTKKEIHRICKEYEITNYTINDDYSIDVDGSVRLNDRRLKELPLKFRNVTGHFDCTLNILTTLEGAPISVDGFFDCEYNNLTSLEYVPSYVGGYFDCSQNNLKSLYGAPSYIESKFICYSNPLESLKGIPLNLEEEFLSLPDNFTYSDYIEYSNRVKRDIKFKKILKCQ